MLFRSCNRIGLGWSEERIRACFKTIDADGSGEIDFDEWCALMTKPCTEDEGRLRNRIRELSEYYSLFDLKGKGGVTAEEFHAALWSLTLTLTLTLIGGIPRRSMVMGQ